MTEIERIQELADMMWNRKAVADLVKIVLLTQSTIIKGEDENTSG